MSVAIVDYGSGNLHSAAKAFERAARESDASQPIVVTSDPQAVRAADRVVLPGVGAFADCRRGLEAVDGMIEALEETVRRRGRPFLGICVGMQLMAERGREYEVTPGLGWIGGEGRGRALGLGDLKFSGQVLPTVRKVVYQVDIKRVMRTKLVLGIADGWLSMDGETIYRAKDLKVGLFKQGAEPRPGN